MAGGAINLDEIARREILDARCVEREHSNAGAKQLSKGRLALSFILGICPLEDLPRRSRHSTRSPPWRFLYLPQCCATGPLRLLWRIVLRLGVSKTEETAAVAVWRLGED